MARTVRRGPTSRITAWMSASAGVICHDSDAAIAVNERLFASHGSAPPNSRPAARPPPMRPSSVQFALTSGNSTHGSSAPHGLPVRGLSRAGLAPVAGSFER